jgi:hypothetical protein
MILLGYADMCPRNKKLTRATNLILFLYQFISRARTQFLRLTLGLFTY